MQWHANFLGYFKDSLSGCELNSGKTFKGGIPPRPRSHLQAHSSCLETLCGGREARVLIADRCLLNEKLGNARYDLGLFSAGAADSHEGNTEDCHV